MNSTSKMILCVLLVVVGVCILFYFLSCKKKEGFRILVNPDGTRNTDYRPYIDQEETTRVTTLYNPHVPYHYGLYDSARPSCKSFQNYFWDTVSSEYPHDQPIYSVNRYGQRTCGSTNSPHCPKRCKLNYYFLGTQRAPCSCGRYGY